MGSPLCIGLLSWGWRKRLPIPVQRGAEKWSGAIHLPWGKRKRIALCSFGVGRVPCSQISDANSQPFSDSRPTFCTPQRSRGFTAGKTTRAGHRDGRLLFIPRWNRACYIFSFFSSFLSLGAAGFAGEVGPPQPTPTATRNAPRTIAAIIFFTVNPSFREDIQRGIPESQLFRGCLINRPFSSPNVSLSSETILVTRPRDGRVQGEPQSNLAARLLGLVLLGLILLGFVLLGLVHLGGTGRRARRRCARPGFGRRRFRRRSWVTASHRQESADHAQCQKLSHAGTILSKSPGTTEFRRSAHRQRLTT